VDSQHFVQPKYFEIGPQRSQQFWF